MAPPPSHRAFRRWYVTSLVDQLRAAARGEAQVEPMPFPQVLAEEVDRLASLDDAWGWLQLLQKVTAELTGARSVPDIAKTVVDNAAEFLGADTARVYLLSGDGMLRSVAIHVRTDPDYIAPYEEFSVDADLPGAVVVRTGKPLFLRNLEQIDAQFPRIAGAPCTSPRSRSETTPSECSASRSPVTSRWRRTRRSHSSEPSRMRSPKLSNAPKRSNAPRRPGHGCPSLPMRRLPCQAASMSRRLCTR